MGFRRSQAILFAEAPFPAGLAQAQERDAALSEFEAKRPNRSIHVSGNKGWNLALHPDAGPQIFRYPLSVRTRVRFTSRRPSACTQRVRARGRIAKDRSIRDSCDPGNASLRALSDAMRECALSWNSEAPGEPEPHAQRRTELAGFEDAPCLGIGLEYVLSSLVSVAGQGCVFAGLAEGRESLSATSRRPWSISSRNVPVIGPKASLALRFLPGLGAQLGLRADLYPGGALGPQPHDSTVPPASSLRRLRRFRSRADISPRAKFFSSMRECCHRWKISSGISEWR